MKFILPPSLLAPLLLVLSAAAVAAADDYVIRVNGKEAHLGSLDFGVAPRFAPGDVVVIDGNILTLGSPGTYEFEDAPGGLRQVFPDGRKALIVATITRPPLDPEQPIINPLANLSPEERKLVRCVNLQAMDDSVFKCLADLDFSKAVIVWREVFWSGGDALPKLPAGTQHLIMALHYNLRFGSSRIKDISSIEELSELRTLIAEAPDSDFDLEWIRKNQHLRLLGLSGQKIRSPELLLRFPELVRLNLHRAAVRDLSHLEKLDRLEFLNADFSRVAKIPMQAMPALRELHVAGSEVTDDDVAKFRERNPECRVYHRWNRIFAEATAGLNRIRILTEDKVVGEIGEPAEIEEFLELVRFHDSRCIDVEYRHESVATLELLAGDRVLGTIGIGIGSTSGPPRPLVISWPEQFPGDGTVTEENATALARFLGERGVPELPRALAAFQRNHAPELRRWRKYERFLPEATYRWFYCGLYPYEVPIEFAHAFPDPYRRVQICLLMLGAEESSWNLAVGLDESLVTMLLPAVKARVFSRVALAVAKYPTGLNGLGRWLFGEGQLETLDRTTRRKLLPLVARHALAHPRRINRQRTMDALAGIGDKTARTLLEEVAAGEIEVRSLPDSDRVEAADELAEWQEGFPAERDVTDAEYAREKLAALK